MKNLIRIALLTILLSTFPLSVISQIISTYGGIGTNGFSGDGGLATSAQVGYMFGLIADASGNIYFADQSNNRLRKISSSGIITTIAGTGTAGFSGDGGLATSANINYPLGIIIDPSGNIYFSDRLNYRIRKINTFGFISTIAGNGSNGFSGDGGPATAAQLGLVAAITMDMAGNIFIADETNNRIRKISTTGTITTIAGTGTAGFSGDGGPATSANINSPFAIKADASGAIYFSDLNNNRIRKISSTGIITTFAGTGTAGFSGDGGLATSANLNSPSGISIDGTGNIYIADYLNHRIRKIDGSGFITTYAGTGTAGFSGDGGLATSAQLNQPHLAVFDPAGNMYISDRSNFRIRKITSTVGIEQLSVSNSFNVFPNPSNDLLTIESKSNDEKTAVLYNLAGQEVLKDRFISNLILNISQIPVDVYILKVFSDKITVTKKIVIAH